MAGKTNLTATLFSQKKLLGKSQTGVHRADNQEPIPSGLQVAAQSIFSQDIPSSPSQTLYTVQSASNGKPATIEYVDFVLESVTGSVYDANSFDPDAVAQDSGPHTYRLVLTGNYEALSNNARKGSGYFVDNQILHWTLGGLQLVPPTFSNDAPNPYILSLYSGSNDVDDQIPVLDELDWQIDYYSGLLFLQDYNSAKIPTRAKGFIYVGEMLSASLGTSGGSGGSVGWKASGVGSISTTGSVLIGTDGAVSSNADIYFSSIGAATFNEQSRNADFRVEGTNKTHALFVDASENQVLLLSGGHSTSIDEAVSSDINFYVSGSIFGRGGSSRGVSLFGGDLVTSGTLVAQSGLSGSLTRLADESSYLIAGANIGIASASNGAITISASSGVSFDGGVGSNNQMITADGAGNIVAETNITFNGSSLDVSGNILPGGDNIYNLGSASQRFANIYTGDLHLRNERGHWQIIEEADSLTVINRLTGKKYKMVLELIENDE